MKLLRELTEEVQILTESVKGKKKFFLEGPFIQGEVQNRNGRSYPMQVLEKEVHRYIKEYVETNRAYGELGHPDTPIIQLDRVSHMIRELRQDGNNFYGKAEILETPNGNIVKALMEAGASLGVSSRGIGSLKQEGNIDIVQNDFRLMTAADIVADPSAPDAYVTAVMENKEWIFVDGKIMEKDIDQMQREVRNASSSQLDEVYSSLFIKAIEKLSKP